MQHTIVDLHVHTNHGSLDSVLTPRRLSEAAPRIGLHGATVTEHDRSWSPEMAEQFQTEDGPVILPCREIETDMGHMLVLGLDHPVRYNGHAAAIRNALESLKHPPGVVRPASAAALHRIVRDEGALLILAHPFRYFRSVRSLLFGDRPEEAAALPLEALAEHPAFSMVDEIEVLNGDCTDDENNLAMAVAAVLGRRGTAGSDAHTAHDLGRCVTVFEQPVASMADVMRELVAGRFAVARRVSQPGIMVEHYVPWSGGQ